MLRPYRLRPKITPERLAALAVALAPLAYFFPALAGAVVLAPDDGLLFNVPLRAAAARVLLDGHLPLWNPYVFSGMPLHAAAQAGLLFPLNWLYLLFEPAGAANLSMLLTYALAGVGAFLYARRAGASVAGACATALVWQFCGFMVGQIGHTNVVQTGALLPWLLWAVDGYGQEDGGARWRGLALSAVVALQAFVGHSQTFAYSLLLASAYAVFNAFVSEGRTRRRYLCSLVFVAAGVPLAAAQLLPTRELLTHSLRSEASYEFFTSFSMPPRFLWAFVAPYVTGGGDGQLFRAPYTGEAFYLEYVGYAGLLALMLAGLALALKRDARTLFWAAAALVCLALASGKYFPFGLYKLVYHVPVLNLFRVPARHLLEVDFALAVLAGRGLTALEGFRGRKVARLSVVVAGACAVLLAWAAVTVGRPNDFRLGRQAPVTLLRAPELFAPLVVAALCAWALWFYARRRSGRRAEVLLFVVLVFDLALWGQFTGWRRGPTGEGEPWSAPEAVRVMREHAEASGAAGPHRILTVPRVFAPNASSPPSDAASGMALMELQPNTYMMHGVENAAGYDGFGLARYSRLAGDMKLWGELPDPARSLRGEGREFDLLNVRYLVARAPHQADANTFAAASETTATTASAASAPPAPERFGGDAFAAEDLGVAPLDRGERLLFTAPRVATGRVALVTSLSWSADIADGAEVGRVRLRAADGRTFEFALRAGEHTAEWAYERADVRARVRHRRAPVASSFAVEDARGRYDGHTYVAAFDLPERATVTGGEIEVARIDAAPDLGLDVRRLSLSDGERAFPLGRELVRKAPARAQASEAAGDASGAGERWRLVAEAGRVSVYENTRALPRAWLASESVTLPDEAALRAIRTGKLPDGRAFDPLRTALVGASQKVESGPTGAGGAGEARVTRHGPNHVEVEVTALAPAVLVLSENFYPGWRAEVDGRAAELLRVDYNLRGVVVAPGRHEVGFVYRPRSVLWGALISLLTLAALLAWCLRGRTKNEAAAR